MDTKKIIIGLIGGAVAGYVYYEYIAKNKVVKTVTQGVEEAVVEGEEAIEKSVGGFGGGGGGAVSTDTSSTGTTTTGETGTTTTTGGTGTTTTTSGTGATTTTSGTGTTTTSPTTKPIAEVVNTTKPLIYTKPRLEYTSKELMTVSKFSGIGGDKWEADIEQLDI